MSAIDEKAGAVVGTEAVDSRPADAAAPPASARDSQGQRLAEKEAAPAATCHLAPSQRLTGHQKFYIFVLDGLGGMALSAGVNFAIAYVMYTTQDTTKNPIRLFQLPNTLAGDAAVTIIIQCILTWFVEWGLVAHDLSNRSVQPIGFISEPTRPILRRLFLLDNHQPSTRLTNVAQQALRGFLLSVVSFALRFEDRWIPQFFKFVLGGTLGLLTTPLMAMFWLVKAGWGAQRTHEPVSEALSV